MKKIIFIVYMVTSIFVLSASNKNSPGPKEAVLFTSHGATALGLRSFLKGANVLRKHIFQHSIAGWISRRKSTPPEGTGLTSTVESLKRELHVLSKGHMRIVRGGVQLLLGRALYRLYRALRQEELDSKKTMEQFRAEELAKQYGKYR